MVLAPPRPIGSCLLLPRPWALLLRVLIQVSLQAGGGGGHASHCTPHPGSSPPLRGESLAPLTPFFSHFPSSLAPSPLMLLPAPACPPY